MSQIDTTALVSEFEKFLAQIVAANGATPAKGKKGKSAPVEDVEEDEEEDEELEAPDREVVEGLKIKELRELAAEYGIESKTKADILAQFEDLYDEEDEDEEEEEDEDADEDDEEEEEEDEDEAYDPDELAELDLPSLRKIAKSEGHSAADVKGLDQDALIELIMGEDADDEEEDEEDEDDEDEVEELDEDALKAMSQKDLIALAKEIDVKVPKALQTKSAKNQKKIVALILESGDEE